jgi:hypothetical protein
MVDPARRDWSATLGRTPGRRKRPPARAASTPRAQESAPVSTGPYQVRGVATRPTRRRSRLAAAAALRCSNLITGTSATRASGPRAAGRGRPGSRRSRRSGSGWSNRSRPSTPRSGLSAPRCACADSGLTGAGSRSARARSARRARPAPGPGRRRHRPLQSRHSHLTIATLAAPIAITVRAGRRSPVRARRAAAPAAQMKFRGACLDGSPTIGDQRLNACRQARVVVGRSGAVETGLDDHAGIPASDGISGDGLSDPNRDLVSSASFTRPVRDRIADALLFAQQAAHSQSRSQRSSSSSALGLFFRSAVMNPSVNHRRGAPPARWRRNVGTRSSLSALDHLLFLGDRA